MKRITILSCLAIAFTTSCDKQTQSFTNDEIALKHLDKEGYKEVRISTRYEMCENSAYKNRVPFRGVAPRENTAYNHCICWNDSKDYVIYKAGQEFE